MDSSGKVIWAKHNEVQQGNLAKIKDGLKDGEAISISTKDLGSCEIYPQTMRHNPNGRFVVVCGDGEYIIHTALNLRNKSFGSALDFVWAANGEYAIRETSSKVKVFKNFKEKLQIPLDYSAEGIFGGTLLAIKGGSALSFYSWETGDMIRRIEIDAIDVKWSLTGDQVCISTEDSFYILKYDAEAVAEALAGDEEVDEDEGIEAAFGEDIEEIEEKIATSAWVGDVFIYTNSSNRLNYHVGGEIVTIAHLDRPMYLLGYLTATNRLYLCDKDVVIVSYQLHEAVLEYQTAVMRADLDRADELLQLVPMEQRTQVAHFLEKQGFKEQALMVSVDPEHRFELAIVLGRLDIAKECAAKLDSPAKWKTLSETAMRRSDFDLAEECMEHANDSSGLLLLYTAAGKADKLSALSSATSKEEKTNVSFVSLLLQGKLDECIALLVSTNRLAEAALFARTYAPSKIDEVVELWRADLATTNPKAAAALASPKDYANLFPGLEASLAAETYFRANTAAELSASSYSEVTAERAEPLEDRMGGGEAEAVSGAEEEEAEAEVEAEAAAEEEEEEEEAAAEEEPAAPAEEEINVDDLDLDAEDDGEGDDIDVDDLDLDADGGDETGEA